MIFENVIRWLLPIHLVAAAVLVGTATHQVIWSRGYVRGNFAYAPGERRFVTILVISYLVTFVLGNCLYPVYKVRVRAEYLDDFVAVKTLASESAKLRAEKHFPPAPSTVRPLRGVALVFDIKEHAVALGCAASVALFVLSRRAHPSFDPSSRVLYLGLSWFACAMAWTGAVIGIVTASIRSVASLT